MSLRIRNTTLLITAVLLFSGVSSRVEATVIDFDTAWGSPGGYSEEGFSLVPFLPLGYEGRPALHFDYLGNGVATQNGTVALWNHDLVVRLFRRDGRPFSFQSFDGAELFAANSCCPYYNPTSLRIRGRLTDGTDVTYMFALDQRSDGVGGLADFETINLPLGFASLEFVDFEGVGDFPNNFALDNLRLDDPAVSAVPEPGTLLMVGSGFGCFAAARRRRRSERATRVE